VGVNTVIPPPHPRQVLKDIELVEERGFAAKFRRFSPIPLRLILQPSPSRGTLLKLPPLQGEGLGGDGVKGCGGNLVQEL
jgi:hypothetical protein